MRAFVHGTDLKARAGNGDYALIADFDDRAGWEAYSVHPSHDLPRQVLGRLVETQLGAQLDF